MYSVIGGTTVAVINHFLAQRHQLLMKRELYRELLYREKIRAYGEVYALGAAAVNEFENFHALEDPEADPRPAVKAHIAFTDAIKKHGLFMPTEVVESIDWCEEIIDYMIETPSVAQCRAKLGADTTQDQIYLRTGKEECLTVLNILKQDLGVETLTKDLGEFFRTAALQIEKKPLWEKIFEKVRRHNKTAQKPGDTK